MMRLRKNFIPDGKNTFITEDEAYTRINVQRALFEIVKRSFNDGYEYLIIYPKNEHERLLITAKLFRKVIGRSPSRNSGWYRKCKSFEQMLNLIDSLDSSWDLAINKQGAYNVRCK